MSTRSEMYTNTGPGENEIDAITQAYIEAVENSSILTPQQKEASKKFLIALRERFGQTRLAFRGDIVSSSLALAPIMGPEVYPVAIAMIGEFSNRGIVTQDVLESLGKQVCHVTGFEITDGSLLDTASSLALEDKR